MKNNKKVIFFLAGFVALAAVFFAMLHKKPLSSADGVSKQEALYQCSMHPTIVSNKPDNCPICGMRLTRVQEPSRKEVLYYRHPMRPDVTSPTPAKDEMGMDYIPVYAGEEGGGGIVIPGRGEVVISPERQQLIGLKTAEVRTMPLTLTVRSVGRVAHDPDLYIALTEYREASAFHEKMKTNPSAEARESAESVLRSAELKLRLLGLEPAEASHFLDTQQSSASLLLPQETAWIYAEIYEYETGLVKPGQAAVITSPALPALRLEGVVRTVDLVLSAESRTLKVRIETPNPQKTLKPQMFVDATIQVDLGPKLVIPTDALLDSGERQIVFVDKGEGRFEPREIRAGLEGSGHHEVMEGLAEGERVVSSANFLIDSESKLRTAAGNFSASKESPETHHH